MARQRDWPRDNNTASAFLAARLLSPHPLPFRKLPASRGSFGCRRLGHRCVGLHHGRTSLIFKWLFFSPHLSFRHALPSYDPHKETMPGSRCCRRPTSVLPCGTQFPFVHLLFTPRVWRRIKQGRFTLEEPCSDARPSFYLTPGSGGSGIYL